MQSIASFRNGKGIRKVTAMPSFILKYLGKLHANQDIAIAEAFIQKYHEKCIALENREVLTAEQLLFDARNEGNSILLTIKGSIEKLSEKPLAVSGNKPEDIRAKSRDNGTRSVASATLNSSLDKLIKLNEFITDIDTCLEQRILKTRAICSEKLTAYLMGVRSVDKYFDLEQKYDNVALDSYNKKHDHTDRAIAKAVEAVHSVYLGGEENV